jgi:hypothetical protein
MVWKPRALIDIVEGRRRSEFRNGNLMDASQDIDVTP